MTWSFRLQLAVLAVSLLTSVSVGAYCWRRRSQPGAGHYAFVAFGAALWSLGYVFELCSPELSDKIFWDNSQYLGGSVCLVAFVLFALEYTGFTSRWRWLAAAGVSVPLIILVSFVVAQPMQGVRLVQAGAISVLTYDFSGTTLILVGYVCAVYLASILLLVLRYQHAQVLYRKQVGLVIFGSAIPIVGVVLTHSVLHEHPFRDVSPVAFALNNVVIAWAFSRFALFRIVPVARGAVIDSMSDAVFVTDSENRIVDVNRAASRMIGRPVFEIIGREITDVFSPWPALQDTYRGDHVDIDIEIGGKRRSIELRAQELNGRRRSDGGRVLLIRDVTAQKELETELRAHRDQLEAQVNRRTAQLKAANDELRTQIAEREQLEHHLRQAQKMEAIGRLAGGVAHDFNNMLTAIMGYSELLLEEIETGAPDRHSVEEIRGAAERAASLTAQLLAFSRKQKLEPKILDLNVVVDSMKQLLGRVIGEHIALVTLLQPGLRSVEADPHQIEQVILNLAVNARDAMPKGGKLVIQTETVFLSEDDADRPRDLAPGWYVRISVSDTGIGMDEETRERVFEPFFTTKETGKGTGLGLAIVYGIITQSGGQIEVFSERGLGSSFRIYLPAVEGEPEKSDAERFARGGLRSGSGTILVVEDDPTVRRLTLQVLRRQGYRVLEAASGREALDVAANYQDRIDLLITDMVMPGMGGRELAAHLTATRPETKVLFMSGYSEEFLERMSADRRDFLRKPFTIPGLSARVREILESA